MKEELLIMIIEKLEPISKWKARKLQKLLEAHQQAQSQDLKDDIEIVIHNQIFKIFLSCLDKDSRKEFINTNLDINETCYDLEKDHWHISMTGATRSVKKDGKIIITNFIPREYQKGFYLLDQDPVTFENEIYRKKEEDFYQKNYFLLQHLGKVMDHKQEFVTYYYDTKSGMIDNSLIDALTDYIGIPKVEKGLQKIKS